jgi:hypothetical protein
MNNNPHDSGTNREQAILDAVCRNLGISREQLMADPEFRREVGADELEAVERVLEQEESAR